MSDTKSLHPSPISEGEIEAVIARLQDRDKGNAMNHEVWRTPRDTLCADAVAAIRALLSQRCGRDEAIEEIVEAYDGWIAAQGSESTEHADERLHTAIEAIRSLVSDDKERGSPSEDAGPVSNQF